MLKDSLVIAFVSCSLVVSANAQRIMGPPGPEPFVGPAGDLDMLARVFETYRARTGQLPAAEAMALVAQLHLDPWGHPYFIERHDGGVKLATYGRDAWPGGEGDDADRELWLVTCDNASCPDTCRVCSR